MEKEQIENALNTLKLFQEARESLRNSLVEIDEVISAATEVRQQILDQLGGSDETSTLKSKEENVVKTSNKESDSEESKESSEGDVAQEEEQAKENLDSSEYDEGTEEPTKEEPAEKPKRTRTKKKDDKPISKAQEKFLRPILDEAEKIKADKKDDTSEELSEEDDTSEEDFDNIDFNDFDF